MFTSCECRAISREIRLRFQEHPGRVALRAFIRGLYSRGGWHTRMLILHRLAANLDIFDSPETRIHPYAPHLLIQSFHQRCIKASSAYAPPPAPWRFHKKTGLFIKLLNNEYTHPSTHAHIIHLLEQAYTITQSGIRATART